LSVVASLDPRLRGYGVGTATATRGGSTMRLTSAMGSMWVWWVLVVIGIIAVSWFVFLANRESVSTDESSEESDWSPTRSRESDDAERLLRWRFAEGELTEEEYSRLLGVLRQTAPSESINGVRE